MAEYVSAMALDLNTVILGQCEFRESTSIYNGRIKLCEGYNRFTNRSVSIRSIDRYIRELVVARLLKRWPRKKDCGSLGMRFTSAGSALTKKGLKALEWKGISAFAIMDKIKALRIPKKRKAPRSDDKGARSKVLSPLGESVKRLIGELKPS